MTTAGQRAAQGVAKRPWRITIDNTFLMAHPWHLLPVFVGVQVRPLSAVKGQTIGIGRLPKWAFKEGLYDGIEFSLTTSQVFGRNAGGRWRIRRRLLEHYRSSGWPVVAFHACMERPPKYFHHVRLDLASDDPRVKEGCAAQVEIASAMGSMGGMGGTSSGSGGPVLVFHTGRVPAAISVRERRAAIRRIAANLRPAARLAESARIVLTLENLPRAVGEFEHLGSRRMDDLLEMLSDIGSASAGITFDYGHANTFCGEDPDYIDRFLDRFAPYVEYAHLHYNRSHRPGFAETLDPRRFEGFDQHLPLTRIPDDEKDRFLRHLGRIVNGTPVARRRLIGLELPQRHIFGLTRVLPNGATRAEQIESVRILRRMLALVEA